MLDTCRYIQVILPLKLEWEPFYALPDGADVAVGDRVSVHFAWREYIAVVSAVDVVPPPEIKILPIDKVEAEALRIPEWDIAFWRRIADYYLCSVGEVYKMAGPPLRAEERDERKQEIRRRELERFELRKQRLQARADAKAAKLRHARESIRCKAETVIRLEQELGSVLEEISSLQEPVTEDFEDPRINYNIKLSPLQEKAASDIRKALSGGLPVLLDGVTGSGKTEVYLTLASEVLEQGRNVLYLVPEIALSRQLEDRISDTVPFVQVYHSGESGSRRKAVAASLRKGAPYMVLGTRSALFLPHRDLGLIIVDEEHDTSYKQDSPAPRYHARETAIILAGIHGAGVVLGSATPSLESLYNASVKRFARVDLKEAFYSGEAPSVEIIDLVAERRKQGVAGDFSRKLIQALQQNMEAGGQAVLLRSRRSYAPALQCEECGTIVKCPRCNVSLSYHKEPHERLICHNCGYTGPFTGHCDKCGGTLLELGSGTQKIEEELRELLPQARIARLDSDTGADPDVIRSFAKGDIDILVGTQIVTKGFDFAGVSLVAIIQADNILSQQDFRADEYAIQLLEQFRGRCGRRGAPGRFIIQTREPSHQVFEIPRSQTERISSLLEERRIFGYPPYTRIILLRIRERDPRRADSMARDMHCLLTSSGFTVVGPYAPAIDRVGGQYERLLRISLKRDKNLLTLKHLLGERVAQFESSRRTHIIIDVDPV